MNVKKLLRRKYLSGKELGIVAVENMALEYAHRTNSPLVKSKGPIISDEDLDQRINSLPPNEVEDYRGYVKIHDWIIYNYNLVQGMEQQAMLCLERIMNFFCNAEVSEHLVRYVGSLPAIVTETEHSDILKNSKKKILKERTETPITLFVEGAGYLADTPEGSAILEAYGQEEVKSEQILSAYNEALRYGYYQLEDGTRSDKVSFEEWIAAICTAPELREAITNIYKATELKQLGIDASLFGEIVRQPDMSSLLSLATQKRGYYYKEGDLKRAMFHAYDKPQGGRLLKTDYIENLSYYYLSINECGDEAAFTEEIEALQKEIPEVVSFISKELESKGILFDGKPLSSLPASEWRKHHISWKDLYTKKVYSYVEQAESEYLAFEENERAMSNGLAIVKQIGKKNIRTDKKGYYKELSLRSPFESLLSLEAFFPENEKGEQNKSNLQKNFVALKSSVYRINGFNIALEKVAEYFNLPSILAFKQDVDFYFSKAKAYNDMRTHLKNAIQIPINDVDAELQEKKLKVLNEVFHEIDLNGLFPTQERIEQATELFQDFSVFKYYQYKNIFDDLVFAMPTSEQAE